MSQLKNMGRECVYPWLSKFDINIPRRERIDLSVISRNRVSLKVYDARFG